MKPYQHTFATCNSTEMLPVLWYQQAFLNRVFEVEGFRRPGNGNFISSCFTHCEGSSNSMWSGITINNTTMSQAVLNWWNDLNADSPAVNHQYIDCTRPDTAPFTCNPTCPGSM